VPLLEESLEAVPAERRLPEDRDPERHGP
jgi:hypothetical protein